MEELENQPEPATQLGAFRYLLYPLTVSVSVSALDDILPPTQPQHSQASDIDEKPRKKLRACAIPKKNTPAKKKKIAWAYELKNGWICRQVPL
jgi:hypothetical protein